ncbi:MAG TPA: hypothetical protein VNJ71_09155 [Gemmatimonadales bacterium]|nr:hypothetical protein [Gemmatimonadales bacterium]
MNHVPTLIPLSLLEALRNLDTPVEDGLDELAGEIVAKRLGLSATVAAQIERYQAQVKRGVPVALDEALSVFRLAGRRPDAALVFADAGRRTARHLARRQPLLLRGAIRALPGGLGRRLGARAARSAARRQLGVALAVTESGARAESAKPLSILALPDGSACGFYGAALSELLRVLAGFEGAMIHERCRARGDPLCAWRATPVGGYP